MVEVQLVDKHIPKFLTDESFLHVNETGQMIIY